MVEGVEPSNKRETKVEGGGHGMKVTKVKKSHMKMTSWNP